MHWLILAIVLTLGISFICSLFEALVLSTTVAEIEALKKTRPRRGQVLETIKQCREMLDDAAIGKGAAKDEAVRLTRERLGSMEEFMGVSNKVFQQFVGNARSGLHKVVKVLLKAF